MAAGRYAGRHRFGQPGLIWCRAWVGATPLTDSFVTAAADPAPLPLTGWARVRAFLTGRPAAVVTPLRSTSTVSHRSTAHAGQPMRLGRAA